jgi:hypothetical protein
MNWDLRGFCSASHLDLNLTAFLYRSLHECRLAMSCLEMELVSIDVRPFITTVESQPSKRMACMRTTSTRGLYKDILREERSIWSCILTQLESRPHYPRLAVGSCLSAKVLDI